jgi:hypothetical protein
LQRNSPADLEKRFRLRNRALLKLSDGSALAFPLTLVTEETIATVGSATHYFGKLDQDQREKFPWSTAILMLHTAIKEPSYLRVATINLQTALAMEGVLKSPHPLETDEAHPPKDGATVIRWRLS